MERCSEILRVIDSLQLTARKKVATPVDWKVTLQLVLDCVQLSCALAGHATSQGRP